MTEYRLQKFQYMWLLFNKFYFPISNTKQSKIVWISPSYEIPDHVDFNLNEWIPSTKIVAVNVTARSVLLITSSKMQMEILDFCHYA